MLGSFRSKILIAITSITFFAVIAVSLAFYTKTSKIIENNYQETLNSKIEQAGKSFDITFKDIYYIAMRASGDNKLIQDIKNLRNDFSQENMEHLAEYLRNICSRNREISSIYLIIPEKEVIITSRDYPVYKENIEPQEDYTSYLHTGTSPIILNDPLGLTTQMVSYIKEVMDPTGGFYGYLMVNTEERTLFYNYLDNLYDKNSTYASVWTSSGNLITTKDVREIGSSGGDYDTYLKISSSADHISAQYTAIFTDCSFSIYVDKVEILKELNSLRYFMAAALILVFLLASYTAYLLSRSMYQPVRNITWAMNKISEGDLDQRINVTTKDEIGLLSDSFNEMLDHIQDLINQLIQEEVLKKDAQLKALQYQITPHFMYNTLNSIKYAAYMKGEEELGNLLRDFVQLLQASINKMGTFITVSDEISLLKSYCNLQQFRYDDRFEIHYDIAPYAETCCIPRLLLQPIVENSIFHGMKTKVSHGKIKVSAFVENTVLHLKVEDNGQGMTEEQVSLLLDSSFKKTDGFSGIGVANIRERLALYYKNKGSLRIENSLAGTTVIISLPASRDEKEYAV